MKNKLVILFAVVVAFVAGGVIFGGANGEENLQITSKTTSKSLGTQKIVVYKSPTCGCCSNYASYLKREGFDVETVTTQNMAEIKDKYNIPRDTESCHTSVVGGYFVEGHIPVEAINKLLSEKPDISGIAMPGMPSGSPGMPGRKSETWEIFSIDHDGRQSIFLNI